MTYDSALAILQALERMSERALPEFAPFAATLAQRLTKLVTAGQLVPSQPLWELAVDRFLVLAVDTEGQVQRVAQLDTLQVLSNLVAVPCMQCTCRPAATSPDRFAIH